MPLKLGEMTFYTVEEAAKVLGVSRQTLWRAVRLGIIPTVRYAYRVLMKEEDLLEWKAKHYRAEMARRRRKGKRQKVKATKEGLDNRNLMKAK